jgi:hypothetical protein
VVLSALVWSAVLAVSLILAFSGTSSAGGLSGKSPSHVLDAALGSARAQESVHVAATGPTETYDINLNEGMQTISGGDQGNATLLVVPGSAYLKGDPAFLENDLGLSASVASAYSGKWISFESSDADYGAVIAGDTLGSALSDATPQGRLTLTPVRKVDGYSVLGVVGGIGAALTKQGATGSEVLYVSTSSPYLPVEFVQSETYEGHSDTVALKFSNWGEKVSVQAPDGAIPFSSIAT